MSQAKELDSNLALLQRQQLFLLKAHRDATRKNTSVELTGALSEAFLKSFGNTIDTTIEIVRLTIKKNEEEKTKLLNLVEVRTQEAAALREENKDLKHRLEKRSHPYAARKAQRATASMEGLKRRPTDHTAKTAFVRTTYGEAFDSARSGNQFNHSSNWTPSLGRHTIMPKIVSEVTHHLPSKPRNFKFLSLPVEIRLDIYSFTFSQPINFHGRCANPKGFVFVRECLQRVKISILRVNKQVRAESLPVAIASNYISMHRSFPKSYPSLWRPELRYIRKLCVPYWAMNESRALEDCLGGAFKYLGRLTHVVVDAYGYLLLGLDAKYENYDGRKFLRHSWRECLLDLRHGRNVNIKILRIARLERNETDQMLERIFPDCIIWNEAYEKDEENWPRIITSTDDLE